MRKTISLLLAVLLIINSSSALAATYVNEVSTPVSYKSNPYWAGDQMFDWLNKGLITGVSNSSYRASDYIKKSEFVSIVNMVFGYTETEYKKFSDVSEKDWFYDEVAKAIRAGYVETDSTKFYPESKINREQVAVMLCKVIRLETAGYSSSASKFKDYGSISAAARPYVNAMVEKGYIGGYADHTFRPAQEITRAEVVALFNKTMGRIYHEAGSYGSRSGNEMLSTNVLINSPGVSLQNMTIYGNLYLAAGIGEGEVELYNVTVRGKMIVQGGGQNSITMYDTTVGELYLDKKDGQVRVKAEGNTSVAKTYLESGGTVEESRTSGTGFNDIYIKTRQDTTLVGDFRDVYIKEASSVKLSDYTEVSKLSIDKGLSKSYIDMLDKSVVRTLEPNSDIDLISKGTIVNANMNTVGNRHNLSGFIDRVNINANSYVVLADGSYVTEMNIAAGAAGSSAYLGQNGIMERAIFGASAVLDGKGNVYAAHINAPQVFIQQNVLDVVLKSGIPWASVAGRKITESLIGGIAVSDIRAAEDKNKIVTLQKIDLEIKIGGTFAYPKTITAVMGDGNIQQRVVYWNKVKVDTGKVGSTTITGRVDGYEGVALLTVIVKPITSEPGDNELVPTSAVSSINKITKVFTITLISAPKNNLVGKELVLTRGTDVLKATCTEVKDKVLTFKVIEADIPKLSIGKYLVTCPINDIWINLIGAETTYGETDAEVDFTIVITPGLTAFQRKVEVTLGTNSPENYRVVVLGKELEYKASTKTFVGLVDSSDETAIRNSVQVINKNANMPEASLVITAGLTAFQRKVEVTLETAGPESFRVTVLGKELTYKADTKKFIGMVDSADEVAIRAGVIVSSK